jgi:glutamate/tyrosine decarboxylase-like PLP-dependent enzyme
MATEMEGRVIRWLAQFITTPPTAAASPERRQYGQSHVLPGCPRRASRLGRSQSEGVAGGRRLCVCLRETHTWIHKAADLAGLGTDAIHWIHGQQTMDLNELEVRYRRDVDEGYQPFLVVGSAGQSALARSTLKKIWRNSVVSANSGSMSTALMAHSHLPSQERPRMEWLRLADSVAVDPHKWLRAARGRMRLGP